MKQVGKVLLSTFLLWTLCALTNSSVRAEDYVCHGTLGITTVDNLRVPQNASCTLAGTQVKGNIKVESGATLNAQRVHVIGNIQADGAAAVNVMDDATVGGSIQLKQGGAAMIDAVHINGDLQLDANNNFLVVVRNQVGGNIQIFQNTGGVAVTDNTVDGNLQCKENEPIPTVSGNVVQGNTEDQCVPSEEAPFVPDQIVVKLNLANGAITIADINTAYGTTTLKMLFNSGGIYLLQIPPTTNVGQLLAQMEGDTRLVYAEPNFYGELPEGGSRGKWAWGGTNPSPVGTQYAATMLRLTEAHALSRGGQVIVAVLDTGFQLDHPVLAARLTAVRYDFVDDDAVPDEDFANLDQNGDGMVDESAGHGTHVAGIVSLAAPDAQIMPLRVLDASGRGNVFLIAEAVHYAVQNGAHVINLSLGTTGQSGLLNEVIEGALTEHDVVVVAAAGNRNRADPIYPAAEDPVLAVTAVNADRQKPSFANYGPWVDVAAPGTEVYSSFPTNSYAYWSGTSMATPFIAGQAALLSSLDPSLTALEIRHCILATAEPLSPQLGGGLANFVASLNSIGTGCGTPHSSNDPPGAESDSIPGTPSTTFFLPLIQHLK